MPQVDGGASTSRPRVKVGAVLAACVHIMAWRACVLDIQNVKSEAAKCTHHAEGLGEPDTEHSASYRGIASGMGAVEIIYS